MKKLKTPSDMIRLSAVHAVMALAVVLIWSVIFGASPAVARNPYKPILVSSTYDLTPPADAPEPNASGSVTLESFISPPPAAVAVAMSCKRLTPLMNYRVVCHARWQQTDPSSGIIMEDSWYEIHTFTTDNKGRLNGRFDMVHRTCEPWVSVTDVWLENEEGQVVLEMQR